MEAIQGLLSWMGGMGGQRKGFKVTDADRKLRVGIAADGLEDLRCKTAVKFKVDAAAADTICFQTRDGQKVEDQELLTLPAQTLLVWTFEGQRAETDAEILYRTIREVNLDFLSTGEKVQEFFTEQMKNKVYALAKVLKEMEDDKADQSTKDGDPDWFKGIDSRAKTKEEYMFRRAQDRVRGYYYRTKDDLMRHRQLHPDQALRVLAPLAKRLEAVKYFGMYFDRNDQGSMCNDAGTFQCQGRWDRDHCSYFTNHTINPYRSNEERLIFQTWNLDHRIERTRAIIPAIAQALQKSENCKLNINQIFDDLFTTNNLKLVHIVCHDKGAHLTVKADRYLA